MVEWHRDVGPAVWVAVDWIVTGDPLHSLHSTNELVANLDRVRGISNVPNTFVPLLAGMLKLPIFLAALAGIVLAVWRRGWRTVALPLALIGVGAVTFVAIGFAELALLPRYLTVPAVAMCVFAGMPIVICAENMSAPVCIAR